MTTTTLPLSKEDARKVFGYIADLDGGSRDLAKISSVLELCSTDDRWRQLFALLPPDSASFLIELGVARDQLTRRLGHWCRHFRGSSLVLEPTAVSFHGFISVLTITLITMHESMSSSGDNASTPASDPDLLKHNCEELCQSFVREASVRSAIQALYDPRPQMRRRGTVGLSRTKVDNTVYNWRSVKFETSEFLRHGSTSFIVRCTAIDGSGDTYAGALKCVLLPYAAISSISDETLRYAETYNASESADGSDRIRHMVRVRASSRQWILMDYVRGKTLAEEIEDQVAEFSNVNSKTILGRRTRSLEGNVRLDVIGRLAPPLLAALDELFRRGRVHEDLSPSNIIVTESSDSSGLKQFDFTFIDFGRNYLYARSVAGAEPFSGRYVAPEIRDNRSLASDDKWLSDVYSFGQILISLGNVSAADPKLVPDRFYGQAPLLARLIEDLIDGVAENRLLVFGSVRTGERRYEKLRRVLREELDATQAAISSKGVARQNIVPFDRETFESLVGGVYPFSKEPKKRWRVYIARRAQQLVKDPQRSFYSAWLLGFSVVASICFAISGLTCIVWLWRDLGIGVLGPEAELAFRWLGLDQNAFPLVDNLRSSSYKLGDLSANLPARAIGLSFALASMRYYQNILGNFTTRVASTHKLPGSGQRNVTELFCRMLAIWGMPLILACNLIDTAWWPIASAIGYTGVLASNLTSARFADDYLARARAQVPPLSTVPVDRKQVVGLDAFRAWGPSTFFYTLIVWGFALPIFYGIFKDVYVYAIVVVLVNIGLFYIIKTGVNSLDIRTGLMRAVLAAERLRYIANSRDSDESSLPPRNPTPVVG